MRIVRNRSTADSTPLAIELCLLAQAELLRSGRFGYQLAGETIISDVPLGRMDSFAYSLAAASAAVSQPSARLLASGGHLTYQGPGWVAGKLRQVSCWRTSQGYRVEVEGAGRFSIDRDGRLVALDGAGLDPAMLTEVVLGPPLILALAMRDIWCLHGSAVLYGGRVIALLGPTRIGKSTLAAHLGSDGGALWRPVADDLLPVSMSGTGPLALPRFPQPKLPPDAQPSRGLPERLPLGGIYVLAEPETSQDGVATSSLAERERVLTLVRHTMAGRLFGKELLARHMAFCSEVASRVPIRRMVYPHRRTALEQARRALESDMSP